MKKRILSILLVFCMMMSFVPITVFAAGGAKAILPGTSAQSILKIDKSRLSFAGHEWWVIGQKTDKSNNAPIITLLAVNNDFGDVPFRTGSDGPFENARRYSEDNGYYANNPSGMSQWRKPNEYAGSTLQQKMVSLAEAIPEKEQAVIRPKDITEGITGQEVKAQKLWAFSQEDSIYLYRNSCKYAAQWWTRSSNEVYGYGSWTIHPDGRSGSALNVDYDAAVRPAMEMDLSSVLFISAAEHGKVADLTTPIAEYAGDEWKLTLHDSDRDDFTAKTVLVNGSVLEVEYKNAKVGDNEYISAVIKDADGSISRYTRVVQLDGTTNGTRGRAAIDLTGIDMTGKTLCVFNEQFNGDHKTDYAGALREVKLTDEIDEQFTLAPGGRYYFDLSALNIPGTVNSHLPDSTLHYVPFTYAGTVDAYVLNSMSNDILDSSDKASATTDKDAQFGYAYEHSLFIASDKVTTNVSWVDLGMPGFIFGNPYTAGNISYTLRAPTMGSAHTDEDIHYGKQANNEWDQINAKNPDFIGASDDCSDLSLVWGQDTYSLDDSTNYRVTRNKQNILSGTMQSTVNNTCYRPVLELPTNLPADSLKAVELHLGANMPSETGDCINIIVKKGESFKAPAAEGLSRPDSVPEDAQLCWSDENGNFYKPGDTVPADVSNLSITGGYEVTYRPGASGTGSAVTDMKPHNNILTLRGALFTRAGYTQVGWSTVDGGEKVYGFEDVYTQNEALTLYPVWNTNKYTITFDTNGGSEIAPITQDYGTEITAPDNPTRKGYTFKGWDKEIPETMPAENITVKAQWEINQYTITFDTNGGSEIAPITQDYGTEITAPDNPTRKGYTFKGWDKEIPETMPAENMTVKAQWKINQYTIAFDTNGGSEIAPITQDYGTEITAPDNPTRKGYTFKGWDKEIPKTMPAENITITARWKDTEKPTGEIIIGTNKWNEFLNELTFGIFFKDTQEVTINAVDNSGVVFVSYLVTDKELSEAELNSLVFRAYEEPFSIDPNGEYIVYVMLVDENINITYLRSDRITLDNIQPVISGIENGKTYCEAQTVTVDEKYVDTVTVNGTAVTLDADGGFVLPPTNGEQKIVVTDKAGNNAEVTVTVNNGHTFGEWVSDNDGKHTRKCTVDGCDAFETENCSGGNATCTEKAVCDVCGKAYGEFDGTSHEGGVQEWTTRTAFNHEQKWNCCGAVIVASEAHEWKDGVCRECGYVCLHNDTDKDHICDYCKKTISAHEDAPTEEIKKADTVTAKLPDDSKSPQTGDNSNLILWIALLLISGGVMKGVTAFGKSKKHSAKIKDK